MAWEVKIRDSCKVCGEDIDKEKNKRLRSYCSKKCRNRFNNQQNKEGKAQYQLERYDKRAVKRPGTIPCMICGKWYRQVGSHIYQRHNMTAREYRKEFGYDVKRGQLPDDLRELKAAQVFENGTVNNLKKGKKCWFKKGQDGVGVYERSEQTIARLKQMGGTNAKIANNKSRKHGK